MLHLAPGSMVMRPALATCDILRSASPATRGALASGPRLQRPCRDGRFGCNVVVAAKKKGGKKKGGSGNEKEGSVIPKSSGAKPWTDTEIVMQNLLLVESFRRKVGRPITEEDVDIQEITRVLFEAPFAVLSHDTAEDPAFTYANQAAIDLFETSWEDVVGKPSRSSLGQDPSEEAAQIREQLLKDTLEKGFSSGDFGWRNSAKGTRFMLRDAILWNIDSPSGDRVGQAVLINHWQYEDGSHGGPGAPVEEGDLEPAEAAVAEQAEVVRDLKENKGLSNQDDEVKAAVKELLKRKEKVERIKESEAKAAAVVPDVSSSDAVPAAAASV